MSRAAVVEPTVTIRALSEDQVADLVARLRRQVEAAVQMQRIHAVYAAEANAYRQVLATLEDL